MSCRTSRCHANNIISLSNSPISLASRRIRKHKTHKYDFIYSIAFIEIHGNEKKKIAIGRYIKMPTQLAVLLLPSDSNLNAKQHGEKIWDFTSQSHYVTEIDF